MIRLYPGDELSLKLLNTAKEACDQARELTHKFIQISDMNQTCLHTLQAKDVIDRFIQEIEQHPLTGITVKLHIDDDVWPLFADSKKIILALHALFDNARESIKSAGQVDITVKNRIKKTIDPSDKNTTKDIDFVEITIKDNGVGIAECNMKKIFDPYFSTKERGSIKGMGFGLTLAEALVRRCDGHIEVESEREKGTAVSLFLRASR